MHAQQQPQPAIETRQPTTVRQRKRFIDRCRRRRRKRRAFQETSAPRHAKRTVLSAVAARHAQATQETGARCRPRRHATRLQQQKRARCRHPQTPAPRHRMPRQRGAVTGSANRRSLQRVNDSAVRSGGQRPNAEDGSARGRRSTLSSTITPPAHLFTARQRKTAAVPPPIIIHRGV